MSEPTTERWAYAGVRLWKDKLYAEWYTEADAESTKPERPMSFMVKRGNPACIVGGIYDTRVTREDDTATRHGNPAWTGDRLNDGGEKNGERVMLWAALDRAARTRHEAARRHANEAKKDALDEALAPLLTLAKGMRTQAEKDALIATVIRRMAGAW